MKHVTRPGYVTGYLEESKRFLCRSYFDDDIWGSKVPTEKEQLDFTKEMKKTKGYLYVDNWPFAIAHFSMKGDVPSALELDSISGEVSIVNKV